MLATLVILLGIHVPTEPEGPGELHGYMHEMCSFLVYSMVAPPPWPEFEDPPIGVALSGLFCEESW